MHCRQRVGWDRTIVRERSERFRSKPVASMTVGARCQFWASHAQSHGGELQRLPRSVSVR
eukprot:3932990-Rhodomonas_salina.3